MDPASLITGLFQLCVDLIYLLTACCLHFVRDYTRCTVKMANDNPLASYYIMEFFFELLAVT